MKTLDQIIAEANEERATKREESKPSDERICLAAQKMIHCGYAPDDRDSFMKLARWLAGTRRRGLILTGDVGVGKTFFFASCLCCSVLHSTEIEQQTSRSLSILPTSFDIVIDDAGTETTANVYGKRFDATARAVETRYNCWKSYGALTHITMNIAENVPGGLASVFRSLYGDRTWDRVRDMCDHIHVGGKSHRRT